VEEYRVQDGYSEGQLSCAAKSGWRGTCSGGRSRAHVQNREFGEGTTRRLTLDNILHTGRIGKDLKVVLWSPPWFHTGMSGATRSKAEACPEDAGGRVVACRGARVV
jgi:hypothetical protein